MLRHDDDAQRVYALRQLFGVPRAIRVEPYAQAGMPRDVLRRLRAPPPPRYAPALAATALAFDECQRAAR